jgi:cytidyltransferase-like protein
MKIVAVSGYFDPIHSGHIEYFKLARALGDKLIVILNNDEQICLRKVKPFMPLEERRKILEAIKYVDEVYVSVDRDDETVCKSLQVVMPNIFAKGGDRFKYEIPEAKICEELGIEVIDSLGKKIQSSSDLVEKWMENNSR